MSQPELTYPRQRRPTSEVEESYSEGRRNSEGTMISNVICTRGIHQMKGQTATTHLSLSTLMFSTEEILINSMNDSQQHQVLVQSEDAVHSRDG